MASGEYDVALGSRILGGTALGGGMPLHKYVSNRALTFLQNLATGAKLSEYHTGSLRYGLGRGRGGDPFPPARPEGLPPLKICQPRSA